MGSGAAVCGRGIQPERGSLIAANGGVTVWLWIISLLLFFWPQGIAVIELAHRYPGEGGVYLWAKEVFGDFHGFLSGWCYWTNNMLYVPTVMLYFVGVSVFALGPGMRVWPTTRVSLWSLLWPCCRF